MAEYTLNQLGQSLIAQLYDIVAGGDGSVPPAPQTFLTWAQPGLPFAEEDFRFSELGLGNTAEEIRERTEQAMAFSSLVDFIPESASAYTSEKQQAMWRPDAESRLSSVYGEMLRFSKVVKTDLTPEQEAKLEKFRGLLWNRRVTKDLITDEEREVVEEGPILRAYNERMGKYLEAATAYNSRRAMAAGASGPEGATAVMDFQMNAQNYRLQVKAAADAWTAGGYRNEVDQMNAYINHVGLRDMSLWKQRLLELFEDSVLTTAGTGVQFRPTLPVPGGFARSKGWTDYSFSHEVSESSSYKSASSWKAGGKVGFGLFSVGADGERQREETTENEKVSRFKMNFELAQVLLVRPWFYPEFLQNQGWTLERGHGWNYDEMPSDGGDPPKGRFIGYPTVAIFARDITVESSEFVRAFKQVSQKISGGGKVGWGPFSLEAKRSSESDRTDQRAETTDQGLRVEGMQIIGFVNHLLGKTPNPLPDLDPATFE
jgi:hypothetical protein